MFLSFRRACSALPPLPHYSRPQSNQSPRPPLSKSTNRRQVMKHCSEDGVVSPKTCVYLAEWLNLPNSDELF